MKTNDSTWPATPAAAGSTAVLTEAAALLHQLPCRPDRGACRDGNLVSIFLDFRHEPEYPAHTLRIKCHGRGLGDVAWSQLMVHLVETETGRFYAADFDRLGQAKITNLPAVDYHLESWLVLHRSHDPVAWPQPHVIEASPAVAPAPRPTSWVFGSTDRILATVRTNPDFGETIVAFETRQPALQDATVYFAFVNRTGEVEYSSGLQLKPHRTNPAVFENVWTGALSIVEPCELVFGIAGHPGGPGEYTLAPRWVLAPGDRSLAEIVRCWQECRTEELKRELFGELVAPHTRGWFHACRRAVVDRDAARLDSWLREPDPIMREVLAFGGASQTAAMRVHLACALGLIADDERTGQLIAEVLTDARRSAPWLSGLFLDLELELATNIQDWSTTGRPRGGTVRATPHAITVPGVLVEHRFGQEEGVVVSVTLELVPDGSGQLYPAPALALLGLDDGFQQSLTASRRYVELDRHLWPTDADVRWRLRRQDGKPLLPRLQGNSLGAAIAGALEILLSPDRQLSEIDCHHAVFFAAIDDHGQLGPVGRLFEKFVPVVESHSLPRIHTAVMAATQSLNEFELEPVSVDKSIQQVRGADFHILTAATMADALRLLLWEAQTRLPVDCSVPPPNPRFVGRAQLMKRVGEFIETAESGYLVLIGDVGCGKSTVMAELIRARERASEQAAIYHIINCHPSATGVPRQIASCLYHRLQRKYGFTEPGEWKELSAEAKLDQLLHHLSDTILVRRQLKEVLFIDAADQAETGLHTPLLPGTLRTLPPGFVCIISTRTRLDWLHTYEGVTRWPWTDYCDDRVDVGNYLRAQIAAANLALPEAFLQAIVSQETPPVFLTVVDCLRKLSDPACPAEVKAELRSNPARWCEPSVARIETEAHRIVDQLQQVNIPEDQVWNTLGVLAVARRALSAQDLVDLKLWTPAVTEHVLRLAAGFLTGRPDPESPTVPYRFAHPAYHREILSRIRRHPFGEAHYHRLVVEGCRNWHNLTDGIRAYALEYLPLHLRSARWFDDLAHLLTDFDYLSKRLESDELGSVYNLVNDYYDALYGPTAIPPEHPMWNQVDDLHHVLDRHADELAADPHLFLQFAYNHLNWQWAPATRLGSQLREAATKHHARWLRVYHAPPALLPAVHFQMLRGHRRAVRAVAIAPDDRRLASGCSDGTVYIYDSHVGRLLLRIEAHPTGVRAVVFSPRGDYLATAGRDGSIKLWSPDSGRLLNAFRPPGAYARCLALADDGKLIAFGTTDNLVGVCDPHTGHVLWTGRHQNQVFSLAVSPDGTLLASSGADHCVIVWDIHTGAQVCKLTAFTSWPEAVAFAPNQPILAVAGGVERWEIRFFQIPSGQHVRTLSDQGGGIRALAYSRDGKMLAAGGWDRLVRVLDAETGELLYPLMAHTGRVNAVAFSTDGHTLASGSADRTVRLWDLRRPAAPTNGRQQFHHGDAAQVLSAAFTADGQTLVARHQDHAIRLRDAATGRLLAEQTGFAESISALAVGPHGTIASGVHHLIHIWSGRPTDAPTVLDGHQNYVVGIAWSADDRFLVSGDDAGAAILWDVHTATRLRTFSHLTRLVSAVAISGDAQTVATGNELGQLLLWNAATDHPVHTIAAHSGNVSVIQFSRDPAGRLIATGGSDELVKLFDGRTGDFLREFPARSGLITALVFSPDGRRLASGSVDGSVQVWDTQTGEQVAYLPCDDLICALWFDPTGKKLHAADAGGATHVPHTYLLELMND